MSKQCRAVFVLERVDNGITISFLFHLNNEFSSDPSTFQSRVTGGYGKYYFHLLLRNLEHLINFKMYINKNTFMKQLKSDSRKITFMRQVKSDCNKK